MVRTQPPMTEEQRQHSDELYRARWLALLSVDDMVEGLVDAVTRLGELQSTFFMFTSVRLHYSAGACVTTTPT